MDPMIFSSRLKIIKHNYFSLLGATPAECFASPYPLAGRTSLQEEHLHLRPSSFGIMKLKREERPFQLHFFGSSSKSSE
jgi:hypothetical protein